MGYLNNQVLEIDAILTKKGRELLAKTPEAFQISKFALADDEVDYRLWNTNHSLGTDYYGEVIENMPILEGSPNEDQMMKFKLITMNKDAIYVPTLSIGATYVELSSGGSYIIIPETINLIDGNSRLGYTAVLNDNTYASLSVVPGYKVPLSGVTVDDVRDNASEIQKYFDEKMSSGLSVGDAGSITAVGFRFKLENKFQLTGSTNVTVTITGNETGGTITLNAQLSLYG